MRWQMHDEMSQSSPGRHSHGAFLPFLGRLICVYAFLNSEEGGKAGMVEVYETLLKVGKAKKTCQACNRHMDARELAVFEKYVRFCLRRPRKSEVDFIYHI